MYFLLMEYERHDNDSSLCKWHNRSQLQRSGLMEPRNVAGQNSNSEGLVTFQLWKCYCEYLCRYVCKHTYLHTYRLSALFCLLGRIINPCFRCLLRHICICSTPTDPTFSSYFNFAKKTLVAVSGTECIIWHKQHFQQGQYTSHDDL